MKKVLCLSLLFTILCALLTFTPAAAATYGDLSYEKQGDHIEITGCIKNAVSVTIPDKIDGLPVTSIGDRAFEDCSDLKTISISNNVKSIGHYSFYGCINLTDLVIPNSVTNISCC